MSIKKQPLKTVFPLRPDFIVTIEIPRSLTVREAERLAAFLKTLASEEG